MELQSTLSQDEQVSLLLERIAILRGPPRVLIAVAGGPGSGKSTLCTRLLQRAHMEGLDDIVVVPIDGFHCPKSYLAASLSPTEAFARRGAPFTFDAHRFVAAVRQLKANEFATTEIALPGFDHAMQDPVEDEISVAASAKVILLEGNYVLLRKEPWDEIAELADERWYVDVPREVAKTRLVERHLRAGIETCPLAAAARAEGNDMQNADYIASRLIEPDVTIRNF